MSGGSRVGSFAGSGLITSIPWLLVLIGPTLVGDSAWASCGDYLHTGRGHSSFHRVDDAVSQVLGSYDGSVHDDDVTEVFLSRLLPRSGPSVPACTGPLCRKSAPAPLRRSESSSRDQTGKKSCLCLIPPLLVEHPWVHLDPESERCLIERRLGGIERPPKFA